MIYLYTGTPGSGKSLHQAELIYYAVKRGEPVIANFDINRDLFEDSSSFHYVDNSELTPSYLRDFSMNYFEGTKIKEGKIMVFIDECAIQFNARTWNDKSRKDWVKLMQLHRKLGMDIFLISQFDTMIDKQIRSLVEYEVKHRKVNNIGWFGKLVNIVMLGRATIVGVSYWYPTKMRLRATWIFGRKKLYSLYDTYMVFESDKDKKVLT